MTSEISKIEAYAWATKDVVVGVTDLTIEQAIAMINKNKFRRLPIVDDTKLVGMITVTDLIHFFVANKGTTSINDLFAESIDRVMTKQVISLPCETPLGEAAKVMSQKKIGGLPLLSNEQLVGILTERDILSIIPHIPTNLLVRDFMTENVVTASPNHSMFEAMQQMKSVGIRRLPITENGGLFGIVCASDFLRHFEDPRFKQGQEDAIFGMKLEEIMTTALSCIEADIPLSQAASTMAWRRFGALPVADAAGTACRYGRLVGIITERDILKAVFQPFRES